MLSGAVASAEVSGADVSVFSEVVVSSDELLSGSAEVLSVPVVVKADEVVGVELSAEDCDDVAAEEQPVRQSAAIRAAAMSFTFMVNFLSGLFFIFSYPFNIDNVYRKTDSYRNGKRGYPDKVVACGLFLCLNIACHGGVVRRGGVGLRFACVR